MQRILFLRDAIPPGSRCPGQPRKDGRMTLPLCRQLHLKMEQASAYEEEEEEEVFF
jgi:hypothetical protein